MFKQAEEKEKRVVLVENMKKDDDGGDDLVSNVPSFNLYHHHQKRPLLSVSPLSRASLLSSECSPSSGSFSNSFCSSEDGSPYQTANSHYLNGRSIDSRSPREAYNINGNVAVELGLSQNLNKMSIWEEQNGGAKFEMDTQEFGFAFGDSDGDGNGDGPLGGGSVFSNVKKCSSYGGFNDGVFDIEGFQSSPYGVSLSSDNHFKSTFHGGFGMDACDPVGSFDGHNRSNDLCSKSSHYTNQSAYIVEQRKRKEQGRSWNNRGLLLQNSSSFRPYFNDALFGHQQYERSPKGDMGVLYLPSSPRLNVQNSLYRTLLERSSTVTNNAVPHSLSSINNAWKMKAFSCEDGVSMTGLNQLSSHKRNSFNETAVKRGRGKGCIIDGGICEDNMTYSPSTGAALNSSLCEVQGYIYLMAQDQNGCRFLQRIFDEGTNHDIEIIFNEIIDHVVELMLKPFGNYVIQKFLDVCNEEQRLQIVLIVTQESRQLVRICLNTYGTRVVQKLIETLKTNHQISLVILAMKPGVLDLMMDQNGNHVIQCCLQCLSNQYKKFIFDAAEKFCVEIATHRHGCCVLQKCIGLSEGEYREKLIIEVSKNGLLLAQDPFGNYVVQYIIELKSSSAVVNLLSQFKGHYIHLSVQKFSSHVVEKCLKHFEDSRPQVVRELLSVSNFDQLLQDPFANYVIKSALAVTKGPLHSLLVEAVLPHRFLRTSPYCKRIFSRNLLKK